MVNGADRLIQLKERGVCCSQVLLIVGLEDQGKTDRDLVRAVSGLAAGMFSGEICGTLTGGACLLGLYAGRGTPDDAEDHRLRIMVGELVEWFSQEYGRLFGGIRCDDILGGDANACSRCGSIVLGTYEKIRTLLVENGFDLESAEHKKEVPSMKSHQTLLKQLILS
ncbi:MAG: C_GCAxxG_C_C family protein [Deltaproteobacteria bacterium]|nr:C_GCAxxG_C_C family protein [Deltaproteobacteria bacterium]